jgi:site-specific DNA recombinase
MQMLKEPSSNGSDRNRYAAIYARVSTEDQGKGFSIPTQKEACQKLAAHEGYTVPEGHVLIDEGISGTTMDRPGLRKLRDLVAAQAITAIIVYDPDRLSRNLGHQLLLAEEMERAAVKLLIVSHPLEQGPEGWLFFQMRGALAEYERAKLMERTHRGRTGRAQAGNPWGGRVPLGYRYVNIPRASCESCTQRPQPATGVRGGHWEVDEAEAALVRRIFTMCLSGMSTYAIALQLSRERILTRGNGRRILKPGIWQASSVHRMLTNEAYAGRTYFGKYKRTSKTTQRLRPREEWIAIQVPSILDEATFQAAQAQLARNRELSPRNKKREYHLRGGHLCCGRCGRAMTGAAYRNIRVYRCSSMGQVLDPDGRCYGQVKADDVEPKVWAAAKYLLEHPELIAEQVRRRQDTADDQRVEIQRDLAGIEAALAKCDREARRWADAYAQEVINLAELKGYRAEIEVSRQSLLTEQAAKQAKLEGIERAMEQVGPLIAYCKRVQQELPRFDDAGKRLALGWLGIRAIWRPGEPLEIHANIPTDQIVPIASSCST